MSNVTIVVPVYNGINYLANCIKGLESQTRKDFYVIFVDDCSSDNTYNYLIYYAKTAKINIKIIKNTKNMGPGYSRNQGIKESKTKYVAFCDADDWYEPNYVEKLVYCLEKNNCDMVFCNYNKIINGKKIKIKIVNENFSIKDLIIKNPYSLCLMMIKKSIIADQIAELYNGEDIVTIVNILIKNYKVCICEECLYNYYTRSGSASTNPSKKAIYNLAIGANSIESNIHYDSEVEYVKIFLVIYSSIICFIKANNNILEEQKIIKLFYAKNPKWKKNKYISIKLGIKYFYYKSFSLKYLRIYRKIGKIIYYLRKILE